MWSNMFWFALLILSTSFFSWWFFRRGVRVGSKASHPRRVFLISPERIEKQIAQFHMPSDEQLTLSLNRLPHHGCPSLDQWLALVHFEPATAHTLIHQLYMRLYQSELRTEVSVITSIEAYHAALDYLTTHEPTMVPPQPLWRDYPTEREWQEIAQTDHMRMRRLIGLLEKQRARFGLSTPIVLEESLESALRILRTVTKSSAYPEKSLDGSPPDESHESRPNTAL